MAGITKAALSAGLNLLLGPGMTDQFRRDTVALTLIGAEPGAGENCVVNVKGDGRNTAGAHSEGEDVEDADFSTHGRFKSTVNWGEYWALAKLSGLSEAVAANGGYVGGDVMQEELTDAIDELAVKLGAHVYSGNSGATPPQLAGAARFIDSSDDNFGGIDTGDNTWWSASEQTITGTPTLEGIRTKLFRPVKDATGRLPEFVTLDGTSWDAMQSLFDANGEVVHTITTTAAGTVDIQASFGQTAYKLDGVPFVEDRHATASTLYAWQSRFVKIRQLRKPVDSGATPAEIQTVMKALTGVDISVDEVMARIRAVNQARGLMPMIEALAKTGDSRKFMVTVKAQLAWKRRNAFAKVLLA